MALINFRSSVFGRGTPSGGTHFSLPLADGLTGIPVKGAAARLLPGKLFFPPVTLDHLTLSSANFGLFMYLTSHNSLPSVSF